MQLKYKTLCVAVGLICISSAVLYYDAFNLDYGLFAGLLIAVVSMTFNINAKLQSHSDRLKNIECYLSNAQIKLKKGKTSFNPLC